MMVRDDNSVARQLQVQGTHQNLRLAKYMAEHRVTAQSEKLTKMVRTIESLFRTADPGSGLMRIRLIFFESILLGSNGLWIRLKASLRSICIHTFNASVTGLRKLLQLRNEMGSSTNPLGFKDLRWKESFTSDMDAIQSFAASMKI